MNLRRWWSDKVPFDFKLLFRLLYKSIFATKGTDARLTPKRILVILFVFPGATILGLIHLIGFTIDNIFFRGYRKIEIKEPVFITGVFRSGTTLLHRLMYKDERFTSIKLWEIFFGPSITEKLLWLGIYKVDQALFGRFFRKLIIKIEDRIYEEARKVHYIGMFETEEDEGILLTIFSSFFQFFVFPFPEERRPFEYFDTEMDPEDRWRIMNYYKRCIQRHMYVFGRGKQFLSKNPCFCPRVQSIRETFPDAKIVCLVRSPLQTVPSLMSLFSLLGNFLCSPHDPPAMRDPTLEMVHHWYHYPVDVLEKWPENNHKILMYDDLVKDPGKVILDIYERFGFEPSEEYKKILEAETEKARSYKSKHKYSPEQFGLTKEELLRRYADVFERFGFKTD